MSDNDNTTTNAVIRSYYSSDEEDNVYTVVGVTSEVRNNATFDFPESPMFSPKSSNDSHDEMDALTGQMRSISIKQTRNTNIIPIINLPQSSITQQQDVIVSSPPRTTPRELFEQRPDSARFSVGSHRSDSRNSFDHDMIGDDDEDSEGTDPALQREIIDVAMETAKAYAVNSDTFETTRLLIKQCQRLSNKTQLQSLLAFNKNLAECRATNLQNLAPDSFTPLHVCAQFDNIETMEILVQNGASTWKRDIQGKTALHIAAEKGHARACEYLRQAMAKERYDPIGPNAPRDLTGATPLGWASFKNLSKGGRVSLEIEQTLFSPGDKSILPKTPHARRAGQTPRRIPGVQEKEDHVYAYSMTQGWTGLMEDRVLKLSPVPGRVAWSLFGVFDGHGGSYCAQFLKDNIPRVFLKHLEEVVGDRDGMIVTSEMLSTVLERTCETADNELRADPRMTVETLNSGRLRAFDSSGSTGVILLVTEKFLIVANVGDSRAVLAQRSSSGAIGAVMSSDGTQSPVTSPFQINSNGVLATPGQPLANVTSSPQVMGSQDRLTRLQVEAMTSTTVLDAVAMSTDHKLSIESERERAIAAGATVRVIGSGDADKEPQAGSSARYEVLVPNFDGCLRMSRSFGDFYLKMATHLPWDQQAVTAKPEMFVRERNGSECFVVLACDGIWDVMSNQEAVNLISNRLGFTVYGNPVGGITTTTAAETTDTLLHACLTLNAHDNLSAILVGLGNPELAAARRRSFQLQSSVIRSSIQYTPGISDHNATQTTTSTFANHTNYGSGANYANNRKDLIDDEAARTEEETEATMSEMFYAGTSEGNSDINTAPATRLFDDSTK